MQSGTQSDRLELSDYLSKLRGRLHIARLACEGMGGEDGGGSLIANMILEVEEELKEISQELREPCETDFDCIREQVELGIAGLLKQRESAEPMEAPERDAPSHDENELERSATVGGYAAMA